MASAELYITFKKSAELYQMSENGTQNTQWYPVHFGPKCQITGMFVRNVKFSLFIVYIQTEAGPPKVKQCSLFKS